MHRTMYSFSKRAFDIVSAAAGLCIFALPMASCALAVRWTSKGPALFRQVRIGRNGDPFVCYKFRTMCMDAPQCPSAYMRDSDRYLTPLGRLLRRFSFDEITQLYNILRGDMSFIGPRPLIPEERELHRLRRQNGVYTVRPGLSGLSQVQGRDTLPDDKKALLDTAYADCASLFLDVSILSRTFRCIRH